MIETLIVLGLFVVNWAVAYSYGHDAGVRKCKTEYFARKYLRQYEYGGKS